MSTEPRYLNGPPIQRDLFPPVESETSTTFIDNLKQPLHGWFRFSAGFSADWVRQVIRRFGSPDIRLFDPFAGSGTAVLAGQECGIQAVGIDSHPFMIQIAQAKAGWIENTKRFQRFADEILADAKSRVGKTEGYAKLIHDCYPAETLRKLDALKGAWMDERDNGNSSRLTWLALTKILRECSPVGTSNMELIQPKKKKQRVACPFEAFEAQVQLMANDMRKLQAFGDGGSIRIFRSDARDCAGVHDNTVDLVITSPPYLNNFDYADAVRLEMTFWNEVQSWSDLQAKVRQYLVRSCAQHMSYEKETLDEFLDSEHVFPILGRLEPICVDLGKERLFHGGRKNYHLMTAAYFSDMARVWKSLRRVCKPSGRICFVVGDSAPYGIYIPVQELLGRLALAAGFHAYSFEKTRERNVKWQNRKHRVPLCEGRLWVEG